MPSPNSPASVAIGDDPRTAQVVLFFEALTLTTLDETLALYAEEAWFKDPFNEVQGRGAIRAIFSHMFDTLIDPRFTILDAVTQESQAFLTWDFTFRRAQSASPLTIHGVTHLVYGTDDRIVQHRDYWDAAEELYAKLPLLGLLMRWLRRRIQSPGP